MHQIMIHGALKPLELVQGFSSVASPNLIEFLRSATSNPHIHRPEDHTRVSSQCSNSGSTVASATLAAVTAAEWMIFVLLSTPTCAFIPKYHCLPFLV